MRQEHGMIAAGVVVTIAGLALLSIRDFNGAGWNVAGAGLMCVGFGTWFHFRGGNVPHPPGQLPPLPMPTSRGGTCPACGSHSIRPMDGAETTSFYGYDRLVLVRPRLCETCGHGFEPEPSRAGSSLMVAVGAVGVLIGLAFLASGPVSLWLAVRGIGFSPDKRIKFGLGSVPMCLVGVWWVRRSYGVVARYWKLRVAPKHSGGSSPTTFRAWKPRG